MYVSHISETVTVHKTYLRKRTIPSVTAHIPTLTHYTREGGMLIVPVGKNFCERKGNQLVLMTASKWKGFSWSISCYILLVCTHPVFVFILDWG